MMHAQGTSPMGGLMSAKPEMEEDMMGEAGGNDPASLLQQAIQLHEGHLNGSVPTSPESQEQLMDLLMQALAAVS